MFLPQLQVLLNKVTELVHFSYILHSDSPQVALEGKWRQFRNKGIVTTEDDRFSAHYIPEIFCCQLNLSSGFYISSFQLHYLAGNILCLLQMMPPEEVSKLLPPLSSFAAPLLAHFPAGCGQNGFFGVLVYKSICFINIKLKVECNTKM